MTTAAAVPPATSLATDQVLSWLHDEESLVTSQRIQHHCHNDDDERMTRHSGSELLETIYRKDPSRYEAIVCTQETIRCLPEQTHQEEYETTDSTSMTPTLIVALKASTGDMVEPFETAHERDMGFLRDQLQEDQGSWFYHSTQLSEISSHLASEDKPSPLEAKTWHKYERSNKPLVHKAKPTTAKAFFGKQPTAKASSGNKAPTKKAKASSSSEAPTKKAKASSSSEVPSKSSKIDTEDSDSMDIDVSKESKPAFTRRQRNKSKDPPTTTATIGTADDFVGDEDEDSDDEHEMIERSQKSKEIVRKQKERDELLDALEKEQSHDLQEDLPLLKKGAMDAFATKIVEKKEEASATAKKKRRKVFREKTTMNAQGFLVTTTEAVWEEISDSEEDPPKRPLKAKTNRQGTTATGAKKTMKKTKPSDMKQGSLKGFFAVKKK